MRALWVSTALAIATICCVTPSLGAGAGEAEQSSASGMAWVMLLLPTLIITLLIFFILRNGRGNKLTVDRSVERFEEHGRFTAEHMKRVESQIDLLNDRLSQVVELLTAIKQSQRQDRG